MHPSWLTDPYVKIYLLYNGQRLAKKKTHVKKRTLNPVFNESFVFDLPAGVEGLDTISLEFLLLDWDRVTKNEVAVSPPPEIFPLSLLTSVIIHSILSIYSTKYSWLNLLYSPLVLCAALTRV